MTAGHTPGPWGTRKSLKENEIDIRPNLRTDGSTPNQCYAGFRPIATVKRDKRLSADQSAANARLIAASPDLLEELENCLDLLVTCFSDAPADSCMGVAITKARAAIAKATGETP